MKPSALGAMIGGLAGFGALLLYQIAVVTSPLLIAVLFPGRLFIKYANGSSPFGHMIYDTLAYAFTLALYAAVGFGLGRLLGGPGNRTSTPEGDQP